MQYFHVNATFLTANKIKMKRTKQTQHKKSILSHVYTVKSPK